MAKKVIEVLGLFNEQGYAIVENIYTAKETEQIIASINNADTHNTTFRKSADLFAIRQFLKEIPATVPFIFNDRLRQLINDVAGPGYFVVKSIYFDKPETSNWYVAWHQDLTISVDKRLDMGGFGPWTVKQDQFAVQPPVDVLENIVTLRIHLDDTDADNGALRVIPGSHKWQVYRPKHINTAQHTALSCDVPAGGVMLMKPLIMHSSGRTLNQKRRRVIHIELANTELPAGLSWAERLTIQPHA